MTNGSPPIDSFSAVEKNLPYVGYGAIVLTTTPLSITCARNPARCAETAAASPHGPPPTITTSASFAISVIPARSGYANGARWKRALHTDDLIPAGANAAARDLRPARRLYAIAVP